MKATAELYQLRCTAELYQLGCTVELTQDTEPEQPLPPQPVHYFGCCPVCHSKGFLYHVGRDEFMACPDHLLAWGIGSNLFSAWHDMTEAQFEENKSFLSRCEMIAPPECTCKEDAEPEPEIDLSFLDEVF